jgi:cytoskeletal protein CcmA (bactofilin family)
MTIFNAQNDRIGGLPPPEQRRTAQSAVAPSAHHPMPETAPRRASVLGKTLTFKGELSAEEDLILQGRVEGSIHHTQSLTVGVDGVVNGDIHARSIVIEGTVEGDLHGTASVLIAATAKVRGNIVAPRVGITEGANFNGAVDMASAPAAPVERSHGSQGDAPSTFSLNEESVEHLLNRS